MIINELTSMFYLYLYLYLLVMSSKGHSLRGSIGSGSSRSNRICSNRLATRGKHSKKEGGQQEPAIEFSKATQRNLPSDSSCNGGTRLCWTVELEIDIDIDR